MSFSPFSNNPIKINSGGSFKLDGYDVALIGTPPFVDEGELAQIPGMGTIVPDPNIVGAVGQAAAGVLQGIFGQGAQAAGGVAKSILGIPSIDPKEVQKFAIGIALYVLLAMGIFALIWPQGPAAALADKALDAIPGDDDPAPAPAPTPATSEDPKTAPKNTTAPKSDKAAKAAKAKKVAKVAEMAA